jgi:hypothetical protein
MSASVVNKVKHPNRDLDRRIADSVLPDDAVNFVRNGELGPFRFVEESGDGMQVKHLVRTYRF